MTESKQGMESRVTAGSYPDWDVGPVVEQIWNDLEGAVARPAIRHEIEQVLPAYEGARITTYVPIFVRQRTLARLRAGLSGAAPYTQD